MNVSTQTIPNLSGGPQQATSWLLKDPSELADSRNVVFGEKIGAAVRRLGYAQQGDAFATSNEFTPQGGHTANFTTGTYRLVAVNNSAGDATLVRYQNPGSGAWTTLISDYPEDAQVFFHNYFDYVFVSGYVPSTGEYLTPKVIDNTLTVSETVHLLNAPKCHYFVSYLGVLYALNCEVSGTAYPDRAYKSSAPLGAVTYIQGDHAEVLSNLLVDSVRYLKAGMAIDIYRAGTDTKLYDFVIDTVDKAAGTILIDNLFSQTFTVNTSTEVFTVSDASLIANGDTVRVSSTTTLPSPLVANTDYYVVEKSGNTFKLSATSGGSAINLTTTGTGTHTAQRSVILSDNDEVWLDGRKGELTVLWNTDYPIPEEAQYLRIPSGTDGTNEIVGGAEANNRLYLFTKNSTVRYDKANLVAVNKSIGCASHRSIAVMDDDWLMWIDNRGRVYARKEGSDQVWVSRGMKHILQQVDMDGLTNSSALNVNNRYKLYLGTVDGEILRLVYDFDSNTWEPESHATKKPMMQFLDSYSGYVRAYFVSDDGVLYLDEEGNLDAGQPIPWMIETGKNNQGRRERKQYTGVFVFSEEATGAKVMASIDGGDYKTLGQIESDFAYLAAPRTTDASNNLDEGFSISLKISGSAKGKRPHIYGFIIFFGLRQDGSDGRQQR